MSIHVNPAWTQEQKDNAEIINKYNDTYEVLSAKDEHDMIDALVNWFGFLPQLWGPNGDAAKEALHSTLDNLINHKNALDEAMKLLNPENGGGTGTGGTGTGGTGTGGTGTGTGGTGTGTGGTGTGGTGTGGTGTGGTGTGGTGTGGTGTGGTGTGGTGTGTGGTGGTGTGGTGTGGTGTGGTGTGGTGTGGTGTGGTGTGGTGTGGTGTGGTGTGGTGTGGHPVPYDPDTPQPHDPLVLDLNQDGKISIIALADSQVYFDLTGDGVKERVGWIAPEDGLLVYDKNMNGKIDGINEVFGKDGLSGFAELRAVADTNYDNVIDRRDALFSQLKVWQDTNSDGISQASELKSLSSARVKNIELNVIGTNINLNGNLLSEAGRYGDSAGERELAADIQLLATERVSSSTTSDTYTIDPITETLPQMRGYGYIDNSFKAYNLDPKLKELALTFMNDKESASGNFGEFILRWSGFYDMAKSKGISEVARTFKSNSTQRKAS